MKGKLLMSVFDTNFSNPAFLAYIADCERQESINKAINMFSTQYNVEDDWDREYVLCECGLDDLTNEEAQVILRGIGR